MQSPDDTHVEGLEELEYLKGADASYRVSIQLSVQVILGALAPQEALEEAVRIIRTALSRISGFENTDAVITLLTMETRRIEEDFSDENEE